MKNMRKTLLAALCVSLLSGCASTNDGEQDRNRGLKTGAAGGAILGLALGAAAGDASLAAKGAMVGAAAGGAAGAAADYQNDREDHRNANGSKNININGLGNGTTPNAPQLSGVPQSWDRLNDFSGDWQINVWALLDDGNRIEATGMAKGSLAKTTVAQLQFEQLNVDGVAHELTGQIQLGYTPAGGYSLETDFSNNEMMRFSGEFQGSSQRYSYYPVGVEGQTLSGDERNNMRVELRFAGKDVFLVDTYTQVKGTEVQIQSYRFTRQG
ncbi:glycine zipper domain-containing protein [uncultured Shewanella sp.]|uniref:glycine zipper domain-containing protein n=1 Tax=uncultured Shewanella sp. TaxID=173975 RepID=UPI002616A8FA|nr:glycine zipper domain-containing protein [uncultured Shewanella sp.]